MGTGGEAGSDVLLERFQLSSRSESFGELENVASDCRRTRGRMLGLGGMAIGDEAGEAFSRMGDASSWELLA